MTEIQQDAENPAEIPPILHSKLFRALKVVAWQFLFAVFFAIATYEFINGSEFDVPFS